MPNHVLHLDCLLRTALTAFVADATAEQWPGKPTDAAQSEDIRSNSR